MMDLSDGISSDLNRICMQSNVGALIEADKIPISKDAQRTENPLEAALNDGEDFELLFTLSQKDCDMLLEQWNEQVPITKVGTITKQCEFQIKMPDGQIKDMQVKGFDHLTK